MRTRTTARLGVLVIFGGTVFGGIVFAAAPAGAVGNRAPNARNDAHTMRSNTTLNVAAPGFLDNDVDADGDIVTATAIVDGVDHGNLLAFPDGSFSYTPTPGFVGTDTFVYQITDGQGGIDTAKVTIKVTNRKPNARNDTETMRSNTTLNIAAPGFLDNDVDADSDPVTATQINDNVDHGSLAAFPNGAFTYTPTPGFVGTDTFVYQITDNHGGIDTAKVTIKVQNKNPIARNDTYETPSNTILNVAAPGFLTNDTDGDGDPVTATQINDNVDHGTLAAFPNGTFTYTPTPGFIGTDTFVYQITDNHGGTDTAIVTIRVQNKNPIARNDTYHGDANTTFNVVAPGFLTNDSDPDGDTVIATAIVDGVDSGNLTAFPDGSFTYTPNGGFVGNDTFEYQISDGRGGTDTAKVTLVVRAP